MAVGTLGCGLRPLSLPSGPGVPYPDYREAFDEASRACRGVRTLTAELEITGRAGRTRIRARALVGLSRPGAIRLEGLAPFGQPVFIFVARADRSVLLLPRDNRVLRGHDPASILEALAGLPLDPDELQAILTGCATFEAMPRGGRRYGTEWAAVDVTDQTTVFLRPDETPRRIVAARAGDVLLDFAEFVGPMPRRIRIVYATEPDGVQADLVVRLSQVEMNTVLDTSVFGVHIPDGVAPLTLDELRRAGHLGEREE